MKKIYLFIIVVSFFVNLFAFTDKDYYDFEENGYICNPIKTYNGYIFTNNHKSEIYLLSNENLTTLLSAPGCGRYYTVSQNRKKIGFKYINPKTNLQAPAIYDLQLNKIILLSKPNVLCGQPSFTTTGTIYYTIGNYFYFDDKKINLNTFSNITALSNDKTLVAYKDKKEQLHILNLNTNYDRIITPQKQSFYIGAFSPNGNYLQFYDIAKNIYLYDLRNKKIISLNAIGKAAWISNNQLIFNKTIVKDFQLISSDIYLYDIISETFTNLTNSPDIFEMNPDFYKNEILYDSWATNTITKVTLFNKKLIELKQIYANHQKLSKSFYTPYKNNNKFSKINLSVPYIHQVYDNWDGYGHKYGCCAAATGLMAIMYYKKLPHWDTTCSDPYSHTSHWGMYIGNVYKYRSVEYVKESQSWSNGGIDDYDWSDGGSPSSNMRPMLQNHGLTSVQHWTSNVTYELVTGDINSGYPYPLCVTITSSGHLILAKGIYDNAKKQLYYHDPYGDKNTAGYPSYDGDDTVYDWPGENNGIENLDSVAWSVSAHDTHQIEATVSIDDLQLAYDDFDDYTNTNNGFFLYTGGTGGMKYWRGETGGLNDNYWWTGAMYSYTTDDYHAIWRPNILVAGDYEIKVYIPNATSATTNARYKVYDTSGEHLISVNQSANTGSWVSLGTFHFNAGTSGYLYLGDGCGSKGAKSKDDIKADKVLYDEVVFESSSGTTTIYSEDFESDDGGLVSSDSNEWQWGTDATAGASSGTHVWGTICGSDYGDHANYTLDLSVNLTSNCKLTFNHWYKIEATKSIVYDGGNVKISDDGGNNFTVIEPEGSYPDTINDAYSNPLGGEKAYSGDSGGWQTATFDLSEYDGKSVIIRWNFGSDGATTDRGWYIDNVKVTSESSSAPLPVVLSSFTAFYNSQSSLLNWRTASETNLSYWNIYRGLSSNFGQASKINETPIPATGSSSSQTSYQYEDRYNFEIGKSYWYWLEWCEYSGVNTLSEPIKLQIDEPNNQLPDISSYKIYNYPNPFNPTTTIVYNPTKENLKDAILQIYNIKGQKINEYNVSGKNASIVWNGKDNKNHKVTSGLYFYRLKKDNKTLFSKKMILLK